MITYSFSLTLSGVDVLTDDMANALFEAGCDDSTPGSSGRVATVWFDREAESLGKAIGSAVEDVEKAGFTVSRVEVEAPEAVQAGGVS